MSRYQQWQFNTFLIDTIRTVFFIFIFNPFMNNYHHNLIQACRITLFWAFSILLPSSGLGSALTLIKDGYKIKVQLSGIKDSVCFLANYYGDKTYVTDTAKVDGKGRFIFEGDSLLPGGVYIIAGQSNNKYLEFIVDRYQVFSIYAEMPNISSDVRFGDSPDNNLFFEYIQHNMLVRKEIETLKKEIPIYKGKPDSLDFVKNKINVLGDELEAYQLKIITSHPESFVSVMLKAMHEPEVKNVPLLSNGREDSVYKFNYYKSHYWDNFDLTDDRLLRTPLFHKRIERYFKEIVFQQPDSIIKAADDFIKKTRPNKEVFKYSIWYLTYKFETSKIMGFDEIFVHMVDAYYTKGEAFWADSSTIKTMTKRASALRPILIGQKAPELILIDTAGSFVSLNHTVANYLVVLFYESDCAHCKKEIKELNELQAKAHPEFKVFAVCTDTSLIKWKKFIHDNELNWIHVNGTRSITRDYHDLYDINMTPVLFLLDEKKKIIAKRLKAEQLIPFLENYDKNKLN
jgi:peroxiredoxin